MDLGRVVPSDAPVVLHRAEAEASVRGEDAVEVSASRFGYSEMHRASFVTVSVRNVGERDLRILTVECRFRWEDGRSDTTMVLFRDLPAGGEAQGFAYIHRSVAAQSVVCARSGVRF